MKEDHFRKKGHGRPSWAGGVRVESWKMRRSWPSTLLAQECPGRVKNRYKAPKLWVFKKSIHRPDVVGEKWARGRVERGKVRAQPGAYNGCLIGQCSLLHIPLGFIHNCIIDNLYFVIPLPVLFTWFYV